MLDDIVMRLCFCDFVMANASRLFYTPSVHSLRAVKEGHLLKLPFTTIFEYLQMLRMIALSMRPLGPRAVFHLAAAVSNFYIPWETVHKIQSASGPLNMQLAQVPKMLAYKMHMVVTNELSNRKEEVIVVLSNKKILPY
ncbi:hypothetical protein UlMin_029303 [Ulmus minor]